MNRFDEDFNEIDPITARPFSSGHPDGVWIVSFIYSFILLFAFLGILMGLFKLVTGGGFDVASILSGVIGFVLFLPPIILLFRRSAKVLIIAFITLFLLLLGTGMSYLFAPESVVIPLICASVQGYICFYLLGLKKDNLLIETEGSMKN
jgi:hypothetical protein